MGFWTNIHGGSTHFPIALLFSSFFFDAAGYGLYKRTWSRDLHVAAFYTLLLGASASFVAVLSGLIISGWQFSGGGSLAKHHLFVWPAFGLIVALGVWRVIVRDTASRSVYGGYLAAALVATGLMHPCQGGTPSVGVDAEVSRKRHFHGTLSRFCLHCRGRERIYR